MNSSSFPTENWKNDPTKHFGVPIDSLNDIYKSKYGMPLGRETHERFIATKPPVRRNKDYRNRFRNFVIGYPVIYKITQGL